MLAAAAIAGSGAVGAFAPSAGEEASSTPPLSIAQRRVRRPGKETIIESDPEVSVSSEPESDDAVSATGPWSKSTEFGRQRAHAPPINTAGGTGHERRNSLLEKSNRRTLVLNSLAPNAHGDFDKVVGVSRELFAPGDEGADEHEAAFLDFLDSRRQRHHHHWKVRRSLPHFFSRGLSDEW